MDFLNPKKKRAHLIRLYVGYALMTIVLALCAVILFFATYGYDIDRKTGNIIQNGLITIDAHPETAHIFVNGVDMGTTSNRMVLPAGQYNFELRSDGFRNWSHPINLEGSSIEQIVYPLMFPSKLVTKQIQEFPAQPQMASESPDRHWLVTHTPPSANSLSLVDLSTNKHPIVPINLPTDTFTAAEGVHTYEAIEWANDNTHLLLKHIFAGTSEFIVLDRENPAASLNLNKLFPGQPFSSVSLNDKKANQMYLLNAVDGSLYQADSGTKAVVKVLSGVISYKSYQNDTILYVTNPSADAKLVEVHISQDGIDHFLRSLPVATSYLLDMAQFEGHFYAATGSVSDGRTYFYKDPFSAFNARPARTPQPFRVLIVPGAQYVSFSAVTRFIAVQGGSNFAVYDIETARQFRYDTKLPVEPGQKATWMDGHRLMLISGGNVNIFDFDGTNMQALNAALPAFNPFFNRDYSAMFTLTPATDKTALTRTELKILPGN